MAVFIKGMGNISPQQTWGDKALVSLANAHSGNRLNCVEPDYTVWLDPKQSRRMSRIIKMGMASAAMALREADIEKPDMIVTGTGYGCLEDTGVFLKKMIQNREDALNPTPFIQSTHNSISAQIALALQCQGYNQTYTQGAFSFESALLDATLLLHENTGKKVLLGAIDEITTDSHDILSRFGIYRQISANNLDIFKTDGKGTLHGEGSTFFLLSSDGNDSAIASIEGVETFYKPTLEELQDSIVDFVAACGLSIPDIDLFISGKSGDVKLDKGTVSIEEMFSLSSMAVFKHLCGEYPVASAFAVWLGTRIIQQKSIPGVVSCRDKKRSVKNVLIYNPYFGTHHSLILLKA